MEQRGKPVTDQAREVVALRFGDWRFFDHGGGPGQAFDRAGLDRAEHVVQPQADADWHAFLTTPGLDASQALQRVAWLFSAAELDAERASAMRGGNKVTAPTLSTRGSSIILQGWLVYPPNMSSPMRITITATARKATLVNEPVKRL